MVEHIAEAFSLFASWHNVLAIGGGILLGIIDGAVPGMTGLMAVAVALPFTFYMHPITGILMLVGIYKGAIYGGSISAILISTPGTPAASCTLLDGYPLAQQGHANKALKMALYASAVADFISNLALIFFAGIVASFAIRFGPPEFFVLISFSLTIVAGVSGDSLLRGIIAGCFGLLAATVGLDLVYGTGRFSFGNPDLMAGLSFIPVLIGLFALPELIKVAKEGGQAKYDIASRGTSKLTWPEFKRCLKSIIRGSFIGVILGAIPGIGGAPSAFLSYSEAKRSSKYADRFGSGELEGVAASESGNNGCCGATMIPLLSLGVPGDVITAVILGCFMIHNLTPGPLLFQQNITTVYAIFMGIMLSSFFLVVMGQFAIKIFARVADVPKQILFPAVLVLVFFGGYAVNNSLFDILVMVLMGFVGYFMIQMRLPAAPFLVAFILGPMFEDNLRRSLLLSKGSADIFVRSPICWFFIALTILSVILIIRRNYRRRA